MVVTCENVSHLIDDEHFALSRQVGCCRCCCLSLSLSLSLSLYICRNYHMQVTLAATAISSHQFTHNHYHNNHSYVCCCCCCGGCFSVDAAGSTAAARPTNADYRPNQALATNPTMTDPQAVQTTSVHRHGCGFDSLDYRKAIWTLGTAVLTLYR